MKRKLIYFAIIFLILAAVYAYNVLNGIFMRLG